MQKCYKPSGRRFLFLVLLLKLTSVSMFEHLGVTIRKTEKGCERKKEQATVG